MSTYKPGYISWCVQQYLNFLAQYNQLEASEVDTIAPELEQPSDLFDVRLAFWGINDPNPRRWVRDGKTFHDAGWNIKIVTDRDVDGTLLSADLSIEMERDIIKRKPNTRLVHIVRIWDMPTEAPDDDGIGTETAILLYHRSK